MDIEITFGFIALMAACVLAITIDFQLTLSETKHSSNSMLILQFCASGLLIAVMRLRRGTRDMGVCCGQRVRKGSKPISEDSTKMIRSTAKTTRRIDPTKMNTRSIDEIRVKMDQGTDLRKPRRTTIGSLREKVGWGIGSTIMKTGMTEAIRAKMARDTGIGNVGRDKLDRIRGRTAHGLGSTKIGSDVTDGSPTEADHGINPTRSNGLPARTTGDNDSTQMRVGATIRMFGRRRSHAIVSKIRARGGHVVRRVIGLVRLGGPCVSGGGRMTRPTDPTDPDTNGYKREGCNGPEKRAIVEELQKLRLSIANCQPCVHQPYIVQPCFNSANMSPASDATGSSSNAGGNTRPTSSQTVISRFVPAVMPRPGQPGALTFDGKGVSEFLKSWNNECDDFGYDDVHRCRRLPDYCTSDIKSTVRMMEGYLKEDWTSLQRELKSLFWQRDTHEFTTAALQKLVNDAPNLDLNIFVLKYTAISAALVRKGKLSEVERINKLIDGLSGQLREKTVKFCIKKGWKLVEQDDDDDDVVPSFAEVKEFLVTEAQLWQTLTAYGEQRAHKDEAVTTPVVSTVTENAPVNKSPATPPAPTSVSADPIAELTKQFSQLALQIQSNMLQIGQNTGSTSTPKKIDRVFRCLWCDSPEHRKFACLELSELLRTGRVRMNEANRIVNPATGLEFSPQPGKGGMKALFEQKTAAGTNAITLEPGPSAHIGTDNSVYLVTIHEDGTETCQIVDANVEEKRKREEEDLGRRIRPRPAVEVPLRRSGDSDGSRPAAGDTGLQEGKHAGNGEQADGKNGRKYRLSSGLREETDMTALGEKIMATPVSLTLREVLATSQDVSNYVVDSCRKRRRPVQTSDAHYVEVADASHIGVESPLYACVSGKAKATLEGELTVEALLDSGSEVVLMPRRIHERLQLPIDTEINWSIHGYSEKAREEVESKGVIGVCHEVSISVGGVDVTMPVFVVEHANADLFLGRPWERFVRAEYINEEDGSLTVRIRTRDGRRIVQFCAAPAIHERNRAFARTTNLKSGKA